ncbi:unnamed protein product [Effrenium voratum]|nr:unnamed protein product [Effrenium voratum]
MADVPWPFRVRELSKKTLVIVEQDRFGEAPHIYVVLGSKKAVIIDTGCNSGNLRQFLATLPQLAGKEFQVVNTHIHYDHIMGNYGFCAPGGKSLGSGCRSICQGSRRKAFSENWQEHSLQAMVGAEILDFCVTDWLDEGARIYLDEESPSELESLEVLHTPGHTPDSISLYYPAENRLFTGDLIYPGSIFLHLPGSDLEEFEASLSKVRDFAADKTGLVLSCGHITPSLQVAALQELHGLIEEMHQGRGQPRRDGATTSFTTKNFTLMCRTADVKKMKGA